MPSNQISSIDPYQPYCGLLNSQSFCGNIFMEIGYGIVVILHDVLNIRRRLKPIVDILLCRVLNIECHRETPVTLLLFNSNTSIHT